MAGGELTIRPSRDADVAAIAAIYAHHVLHGVASFEEVPPDEPEIARRRAAIVERGLPYGKCDITNPSGGLVSIRSLPSAKAGRVVATISNDTSNFGTVFAVAPGSVTIKACAGTVCGSTTLTVK